MTIDYHLFEGRLIQLAPVDHEKDPETVSRWTRDQLLRAVLGGVARPLSPEAVKMLEKVEKRSVNSFCGMANAGICSIWAFCGRIG